MTSFRQRFVGATELPKSLTEFDVEQSFQLSNDDLEAIRKRFRTTGRLAAAIQLTVIRTTGRPLDRLTNVPRALLRSLCGALGIQETSIASLKTLYGRQSTLYEHQAWARQASGFTECVFSPNPPPVPIQALPPVPFQDLPRVPITVPRQRARENV